MAAPVRAEGGWRRDVTMRAAWRTSGRQIRRSVVPTIVALALGVLPRVADAQPGGGGGGGGGRKPVATTVSAVQPLQFGLLIPAVTEQVLVTENWRRGEVRLEGSRRLEVRIVLPTQLAGPNGATIPLIFGGSDGGIVMDGSTQMTLFDPSQTLRLNFRTPGGQLFLGGTAMPAATQPAGSYAATVVIVLAPANF